MQKIIIIISVLAMLLLREECHGQGTVKYTAGISYGYGDPTYTPNGNVSKKYVNLTTLRSSTYSGTSWVLDAQGIDVVSGCAAPAYTPGIGQSNIVINNCTLLQNGQGPELYVHNGTSWIFINEKSTVPAYTAGTGINISGTVISNTGDLSNINELQNLSLTGQALGISSGNTVTLPVIAVAPGTGIGVSNSAGTATVTNTGDLSNTNELQTLSVAGNNLTISDGNTVTLPTPSSTLDVLTDVTITSPTNAQILQYNTATTQWVNATLAAITGSGTSNYLPKFTGSGAIGNSLIYDSGSGIGLGTASPSSIFEVAPTSIKKMRIKSAVAGTENIAAGLSGLGATIQMARPSDGAWAVLNWFVVNDNEAGLGSSGATRIYTAAIERMVITGLGTIGIGVSSPSSSARLDISSTTGGVLFPRMTSTQRDAIASPPDGLVVYNTTAAKLQVRAASAWVDLH